MPQCLVRFLLRCLFAVTRSVNYSQQAMQTLTLNLLAYNGRCRIKPYIPAVLVTALLANVPAISHAMTLRFSLIVIYLPLFFPRPDSDRSRSKVKGEHKQTASTRCAMTIQRAQTLASPGIMTRGPAIQPGSGRLRTTQWPFS